MSKSETMLRRNITLTGDDAILLNALIALARAKLQVRVSGADVVHMALKELEASKRLTQ